MYIEFYKIREEASAPRRANPSDAGMDLAFSPEDGEAITIEPGGSVICGTGLKFGVPHGYMLQIMNRSSVAAKRSLVVGACVVWSWLSDPTEREISKVLNPAHGKIHSFITDILPTENSRKG